MGLAGRAFLCRVLLVDLLLSCLFLPAHASHRLSHRHPHHRVAHRQHVRVYHAPALSVTPVAGRGMLASAIHRAVSQIDPAAVVGIQVRSMKYNDILYAQNNNRLFTPASTLKIMTAEAALLFLGSGYHFTTRVLTDAQDIHDGMLFGNLYLVHEGDPTLTYYDLTDLMVALKSRQIRGIAGNVYIDNTAYDNEGAGPGWMGKDRRYCYAAPISASIINHNCILFGIVPARRPHQPAVVIQSPRYYYSSVRNSVVTGARHARGCHVAVNSGPDNTIELDGCLPAGHTARSGSVVIKNIAEYDESMLRHLFRVARIPVSGNILTGKAPAGLYELATHTSKPLNHLVNDMLKKSDNIIAGSLFKKLGEVYTRHPGSWRNGSYALGEILHEHVGMETSGLQALDGSGLSRENQVTPAQLMQVLDFAFHDEETSYEFISSLPVSGQDGTLKNRLSNIRGRVRAKTGTMSDSGIISLAGYAVTRDREPLAFVIFVNGRKGYVWKYREMEDQIATALANFTRH